MPISGDGYRTVYEPVTLQPVAAPGAVFNNIVEMRGGTHAYIILEGMHLDITSNISHGIQLIHTGSPCDSASQATSPHHVRLLNLEVNGATNQGITVSNYSVGVELLNLNVHHNGKDDGTDHGIYVAGDGLLIDGGEYHHKDLRHSPVP